MRPSLSLAGRTAAQPFPRAPRASALVGFRQARCLAQTRPRRQDDESWRPPPPPPRAPSPTSSLSEATETGLQPETAAAASTTSRPGLPSLRIISRSNRRVIESIYGPAVDHASTAPSSAPSTDLSTDLLIQSMSKNKGSSASKVDISSLYNFEGATSQKTECQPYHLHVFSHKHNTHITCTRPNRDPIISLSCGNLGYRKSRRGTFDSAYSLTKYVLERLSASNITINSLELVLRGYGQGREAAIKVLLSPEGRNFRDKIVRVADSTPIKFAGERGEKPRRL